MFCRVVSELHYLGLDRDTYVLRVGADGCDPSVMNFHNVSHVSET